MAIFPLSREWRSLTMRMRHMHRITRAITNIMMPTIVSDKPVSWNKNRHGLE